LALGIGLFLLKRITVDWLAVRGKVLVVRIRGRFVLGDSRYPTVIKC
jgi:hypothetical protein